MKISNMNVPGIDTSFITEHPNRVSDKLFCRDPFIMPAGGDYFLYRSAGERGVEVLVSRDLENWSDPIPVYKKPDGHPGVKDFFWAPECHYYKGAFYLFTSVFNREINHRSISVYRAESPLGPFTDIAGYCVSPREWDCIDGTLYVDGDGQPWLVFVHEWTCMPDNVGAMVTAKLTDDLSHLISEPVQLFLANEPAWTDRGVTDGPFIGITDSGRMIMTWSNFIPETPYGYAVGVAFSQTGLITGPWIQQDKEIYSYRQRPEFIYDGGHAMMFYGHDGTLYMTFHTPNEAVETYEHVAIMKVTEKNDTVELEPYKIIK